MRGLAVGYTWAAPATTGLAKGEARAVRLIKQKKTLAGRIGLVPPGGLQDVQVGTQMGSIGLTTDGYLWANGGEIYERQDIGEIAEGRTVTIAMVATPDPAKIFAAVRFYVDERLVVELSGDYAGCHLAVGGIQDESTWQSVAVRAVGGGVGTPAGGGRGGEG